MSLTDNPNNQPGDNFTGSKTARLFGLFMAAVLAVTPGCSNYGQNGHVHVDKNGDGYCDEDGKPMSSSGIGGYHRNYYGGGYGGGYISRNGSVPGSTGKISTGTAPKGGIGSHATGGGG